MTAPARRGLTVAVTGASGGIGAAIVEALAGAGHRVLALGRSAEKLAALHGAEPVVLDFTRDAPRLDVDRLDGLVHCAGVAEVASVEDSPPELWDETVSVNLSGPAALTRALLPALRAARGRVIFINASAEVHAVPEWSAYVATKAGLRELADSLRLEEEPNGVRVTTIYPGGVEGERLEIVRRSFGLPYDPTRLLRPQTLAEVVRLALEFPDGHFTEIAVRVAPPPER